jgi:hypothetical protein
MLNLKKNKNSYVDMWKSDTSLSSNKIEESYREDRNRNLVLECPFIGAYKIIGIYISIAGINIEGNEFLQNIETIINSVRVGIMEKQEQGVFFCFTEPVRDVLFLDDHFFYNVYSDSKSKPKFSQYLRNLAFLTEQELLNPSTHSTQNQLSTQEELREISLERQRNILNQIRPLTNQNVNNNILGVVCDDKFIYYDLPNEYLNYNLDTDNKLSILSKSEA